VTPVETNPLAILSFMAAPAILTNASSVLALGTSNRFARNIDRTREIIRLLQADTIRGDDATAHRVLLGRMEQRCALLVRAMSLFYFSVGCFAAGSLTSLIGAILASTHHPTFLTGTLVIAMVAGAGGLGGLILGGLLLVRETRLALATIREEARIYRVRLGER
jgi:hypothetical protein